MRLLEPVRHRSGTASVISSYPHKSVCVPQMHALDAGASTADDTTMLDVFDAPPAPGLRSRSTLSSVQAASALRGADGSTASMADSMAVIAASADRQRDAIAKDESARRLQQRRGTLMRTDVSVTDLSTLGRLALLQGTQLHQFADNEVSGGEEGTTSVVPQGVLLQGKGVHMFEVLVTHDGHGGVGWVTPAFEGAYAAAAATVRVHWAHMLLGVCHRWYCGPITAQRRHLGSSWVWHVACR